MGILTERTRASELAAIALLASSLFLGCSAEKPIPVNSEVLSGPDATMLVDRRVMMDGEISYFNEFDASYTVSNGFMYLTDGVMIPLGDTVVPDTDYKYRITFPDHLKMASSYFVVFEERLTDDNNGKIPVKVSGIFLGKDESGAIKLDSMRVEALVR